MPTRISFAASVALRGVMDYTCLPYIAVPHVGIKRLIQPDIPSLVNNFD
jgi:hypothetical protein